MSATPGQATEVARLPAGSDIELARFFGGWSLRREGVQVGIVMDTVYVKVAKADRLLWRESGARPFSYGEPERVVEAYWTVPAGLLDDADGLYCLLTDPRPLP